MQFALYLSHLPRKGMNRFSYPVYTTHFLTSSSDHFPTSYFRFTVAISPIELRYAHSYFILVTMQLARDFLHHEPI